MPDPAAQTQRAIHALRNYLERADPAFCSRTQLWIHGLIVFAHPRSTVVGEYSPVPALSPEDAVTAIAQTIPRRLLSRAEQERIVDLMAAAQPSNALEGVQPRPAERRRVALGGDCVVSRGSMLWACSWSQFARDWRSCRGPLQRNIACAAREGRRWR